MLAAQFSLPGLQPADTVVFVSGDKLCKCNMRRRWNAVLLLHAAVIQLLPGRCQLISPKHWKRTRSKIEPEPEAALEEKS